MSKGSAKTSGINQTDIPTPPLDSPAVLDQSPLLADPATDPPMLRSRSHGTSRAIAQARQAAGSIRRLRLPFSRSAAGRSPA
ncbi:hypothetical protein [Bifidobacterium asteroides]|uniref:hypothetical protein n=1 Tax=Bifidobacterium asteroides TaxID=1684 RepID=UPI0015D5F3D7|nr:hypothetical protein [Bifidobacterium asteroides]